jgi:hypothetical protein
MIRRLEAHVLRIGRLMSVTDQHLIMEEVFSSGVSRSNRKRHR